MTKHMHPGFGDPNMFDVGIAISKTEIPLLRSEDFTWFDRYGNVLFQSTPVKTTAGVAWNVDLETIVHETTRFPTRQEFESIEAMMFLAGLLDKMMRDAGY